MVNADPYEEATWLADAAHAADPAWPPLAAAQDRATPRRLHSEPTLQSDPRYGDSAPASTRLAGPSSPGLLASSEPGSAPPPRSRLPVGSAASTRQTRS